MGRFISGIIALLGIGLIALPTGIISAGFMERIHRINKEDNASKAYVEKLQQLEEMKQSDLVSDKEYEALREKILKKFVE